MKLGDDDLKHILELFGRMEHDGNDEVEFKIMRVDLDLLRWL